MRFSHWRELRPTVNISRGAGPVRELPRAERTDIDAVRFVPLGGTAPVTWAESLTLNYTDGIVVLHRGRIVYERYFGALAFDRPHMTFSVTKSFTGTFTYRTPNVDIVGLIIARLTNQSPAAVLSDRIWSRMGPEGDAFLQVDDTGVPLLGSSLNGRLRDPARFGELMRLDGTFSGVQIVPARSWTTSAAAAAARRSRRPNTPPFLAGAITTSGRAVADHLMRLDR